MAAVRVVTELFHQTERECEAGGRAADACCVDADPDRKLADEGAGLVDEDPDRGGTSVLETADRPDRRRRGPASPAENQAQPYAVLTGDTLFIGDVGRPDLRVALGWSAIYAAGQYGLIARIEIPFMVHWHGAINAAGAALCGLFAWHLVITKTKA